MIPTISNQRYHLRNQSELQAALLLTLLKAMSAAVGVNVLVLRWSPALTG